MSHKSAADFLVEIGTEELPPKSLRQLMTSFAANLSDALRRERLGHGAVCAYASPRRLAVRVETLAAAQEDRESERRGPPWSLAFDAAGQPTAAAKAFADKCGVGVEELGRTRTPKGEWLSCRVLDKGQSAAALLPALVAEALERLPVERRMRWGDSDIEFVRPVHWLLMLHGREVVPGTVLGLTAGNRTFGHRFLAPGEIVIDEPAHYPARLRDEGFVLADYADRRQQIVADVEQAAADAGGTPVGDDALYDEVTALTEWPVPITGQFDEAFLELPREVIVATLTGHQRYFPVADANGELKPRFVAVSNLASKDPHKVRDGNERVIRPRLADAAFFREHDRRTSLAEQQNRLDDVVYQAGLGSLGDRSRRVAAVAERLAAMLDADPSEARRAASLAKCDLLTEMVGEFPELQGVMGRYYALLDDEPRAVAEAIGEQYLPGFGGDRLPRTAVGQVLAIADKLESLCGLFALGKTPSGNRDPFGLRRAALGIVRITIECRLDYDLMDLLALCLDAQPGDTEARAGLGDELYDFVVERMRAWCLDGGEEYSAGMFQAVAAQRPRSLLDFAERLKAVREFAKLDSAQSLAAANKRIFNILRKSAGTDPCGEPDSLLFEDAAEMDLYNASLSSDRVIEPLVGRHEYVTVLEKLAELRDPIDAFFDRVLVMSDDPKLQTNRLALLNRIRRQFLNVADISHLSIGKR